MFAALCYLICYFVRQRSEGVRNNVHWKNACATIIYCSSFIRCNNLQMEQHIFFSHQHYHVYN